MFLFLHIEHRHISRMRNSNRTTRRRRGGGREYVRGVGVQSISAQACMPGRGGELTPSQNLSSDIVESTLTISKEEVIEGVHSLFCSLANDKTVITVTSCKSLAHDKCYQTIHC